MKMAINVEPDSRTLSSSVAWPWKSHYTRKSVFCDLRLTDSLQPETGLDAHDSLCTAIWTPCYPVYTLLSMRGSRIFRWGGGGGGGSGSIWQKALTTVFLVLSLFYLSQMVNFEENSFFKFQRGSNIFQGVPAFSKGVQLLIPYRNPYNLWFSRGCGPLTPLWIRTCYLDQQEIAFFRLVVVGWYFSVLFKFW